MTGLGQHFGGEAGQVERGGLVGVVEGEQHLEQRRVVQRALGPQLFDQLLERQVLVGVGLEQRRAHLGQQRGERPGRVDLAAQHQGVDEEADQSFELGLAAAGHRVADAQVALAAVALQQHLEGGGQQHERRGAERAAEPAQAFAQGRTEVELDRRAVLRAHGRPRPVGRQRQQRWRAGQRAAPVIELPGQHFALQPAALPFGEVGVLDRQFVELRRPAGREGAVGGAELAQQHAHRPAVRHDVVQRQQQHVVVGAEPQQRGAQQRAGGQVERALRLVVHVLPHARFGIACARQVDQRQGARRGRGDALHRLVAVDGEGGAQRLVPRHDRVEPACERRGIERAAQAAGGRDVVQRAAGLVLVEEPQPLLGERGAELVGVVRGHAGSNAGTAV